MVARHPLNMFNFVDLSSHQEREHAYLQQQKRTRQRNTELTVPRNGREYANTSRPTFLITGQTDWFG